MDFLDPQKQKAHAIRMHIGYILLAITLGIATIILLYQVSGFGFGKNGEIIQNGLVFVGSQPSGADIFVDGTMKGKTGARLVLPSGQYTFRIQRDGYHTWQRSIGVAGGSVEYFTYPFLVPSKLLTTSVKKYANAPAIETESLDHRWLLIQTDAIGTFDLFDLTHPKDAPVPIAVPGAAMSTSGGAQSWSAVEWASDNRHLLLKHTFEKNGQPASEYVLLDRQNPDQSQNLTTLLGVDPTMLTLRNQAYDQYYLYNQTAKVLSKASMQAPQPVAYLDHVLTFQTSGADAILYTSDDSSAPAGSINVRLRQSDNDYVIGHVPAGAPVVLALSQYGGDWYDAFGSAAQGKVYVYKNPAAAAGSDEVLVPVAILKVADPMAVAFSAGSQFVMAESGQNFAVFDIENDKNYAYQIKIPLDTPAGAAAWMDNDRLMLNSSGKLTIFDFDSANMQTLAANDPVFTPVFDQKYATLYTMIAQAQPSPAAAPPTTVYDLSSTSLRTPADQ